MFSHPYFHKSYLDISKSHQINLSASQKIIIVQHLRNNIRQVYLVKNRQETYLNILNKYSSIQVEDIDRMNKNLETLLEAKTVNLLLNDTQLSLLSECEKAMLGMVCDDSISLLAAIKEVSDPKEARLFGTAIAGIEAINYHIHNESDKLEKFFEDYLASFNNSTETPETRLETNGINPKMILHAP